jgi:hypothetical protein
MLKSVSSLTRMDKEGWGIGNRVVLFWTSAFTLLNKSEKNTNGYRYTTDYPNSSNLFFVSSRHYQFVYFANVSNCVVGSVADREIKYWNSV